MKVLMMPNPLNVESHVASGITAVLRDYARFGPEYGIEFVNENADTFDVLAVHAGMSNFMTDAPYVSHCHGLYWTGDYDASLWEYRANQDVISSLRRSTVVTVPSDWVADTIRRDMHIDPVVLPHGIDPALWEPRPSNRKYVLWNKNRDGDVCDPTPVRTLAMYFPDVHFVSTFAPDGTPANVLVTGTMPHKDMRDVIQAAHIYLATTKETFGIGMLEAKASGVPILAYNHGGARSIVKHGIDGYLARPGDTEDLARGLAYCLEHHNILSANALVGKDEYTWPSVIQKLHSVYTLAMEKRPERRSEVSVVIPCYNYAHTLERAVESVVNQTFEVSKVVVVDDGSTDDTPVIAERLLERYGAWLHYIRTDNQGVANARNTGMAAVKTEYACCLDADDEIAPDFLSSCVRALERNFDIGLAYARLRAVNSDGSSTLSDWPNVYDFDGFLAHKNQVPTCCVFRTEIFRRAGGYRQRYAPHGAGSEDANLWMRMGSLGYGGALVNDTEGMFLYHLGGRVSGNRGYAEVDWTDFPWKKDGEHPFASMAKADTGSHKVYQRDDPFISVIIPCSPYHANTLIDAIDSVERQSFREWELIVVFDGEIEEGIKKRLADGCPFVRFCTTDAVDAPMGAGAARNKGAREAKAELLLFLDADDWLADNALERMYFEAIKSPAIVYSDYIGHAVIDKAEARRLGDRLLSFEESTGNAEIRHYSMDYDCELAQLQPAMGKDGQIYIWNIITSLLPRKWHNEIGGFDERMESWEDWDYWIRMAHLGKCFTRLNEPLVHYRFSTGQRREIGRQLYPNLLDYMQGKFREVELMPCGGCKGRAARPPSMQTFSPQVQDNGGFLMSADNMVLVKLMDGNMAAHPISFRDADGTKHNYGYRSSGDEFLIRADHYQGHKSKFELVDDDGNAQDDEAQEPEAVEELEAPTPLQVFTASDIDKQKAVAQVEAPVATKTEKSAPARRKKPARRVGR